MKYNFEWDPVKAKTNLKKHGVSFEEASEIFLDPLQLSLFDNEHSEQEERWITLGSTKSQKLRLIVHTLFNVSSRPSNGTHYFSKTSNGS